MSPQNRKLRYGFRLYILCDEKRVLGKGGAQILDAVARLGSLSSAAKELEMSYRFVWNYIRRMEAGLGKPVILTRRGGTLHATRKGGGGTELTPLARTLLKDYRLVEGRLRKQLPHA